jgi:cytoskeletal protein CcmA (bactofilin family)
MWNREEAAPQHAAPPVAPEPRSMPVPVPAVAQESRPTTRGNAAALGSSLIVKGELKASEDFTIEGRLEGRIDLPDHTLTVGPGANVSAQVVAKTVTVFGTVVGTITAHEKLDVRPGAFVEGELTCARISIQEGAVVSGKVGMATTKGSKPNGTGGTAVPVPDSRSSH